MSAISIPGRAAGLLAFHRRIPREGFAFDTLVLAAGTGASQLLAILASPLIARIYSPAEFGVLSAFISVYGMGMMLITFRYQLAILIARDREEAASVVALTLGCALAAGVALWAIIYALFRSPLLPPSFLELRRFLPILPVWFALGGIYEALSYWALRVNHVRTLSISRFSQTFGVLGGQLSCGLAGLGVWGLFVGETVGRGLSAANLAGRLRRAGALPDVRVAPAAAKASARRFRKFAIVSTPEAIVTTIGNQTPPLLLMGFFGAEVSGHFFMAWKLTVIPISLVSVAMGQAFSREFSTLLLTDPAAAYRRFRETAAAVLCIAAPLAAASWLCGPFLLELLFGAKWRGAGVYVRYLSIYLFAAFSAGPFTEMMTLLERQVWKLGWSLGGTSAVVGALWAAAALTRNPHTAALVFVLVYSASLLTNLALGAVLIRRAALAAPSAAAPRPSDEIAHVRLIPE